MKQVEQALQWLATLLSDFQKMCGGVARTVRWRPTAPVVLIQTDACPTGMGGFVKIGQQFVAYWHDKVQPEDEEILGAVSGDPAFQSELELLAVLISFRVFRRWLEGPAGPAGVLLRVDNTATLMAAMELRGRSMLMAQLAAEVALEVERLQLPHMWGQHIPGLANDVADRLSRLKPDEPIPSALRCALQVAVPRRVRSFYRSWRQAQS